MCVSGKSASSAKEIGGTGIGCITITKKSIATAGRLTTISVLRTRKLVNRDMLSWVRRSAKVVMLAFLKNIGIMTCKMCHIGWCT
jgi:hypothetical protein